MKRYVIELGNLFAGEVETEMIKLADAEAEIEKARQDSHYYEAQDLRMEVKSCRADERERIKQSVRRLAREKQWAEQSIQWLIEYIDRPAQESKPLEKMPAASAGSSDHYKSMVDTVNALIDVVKGIHNWIARHDT